MNNMLILRLLSEEVFDFNTGLTSARAAQLKQQFCGQFQSVHELCQEILVSRGYHYQISSKNISPIKTAHGIS